MDKTWKKAEVINMVKIWHSDQSIKLGPGGAGEGRAGGARLLPPIEMLF